jgi:segregation and condensation protein A
MSAAPGISLPCFEGPLDLLLALVRKNEVPISGIPIARITQQYLEYLDRAAELDLDLGSDFAYMASLLIHIKSQYLLPADPEIAAREPDPRQELVRLLLDHEQVRQAAGFLQQKLEVSSATWSKSSIGDFVDLAWEENDREPGAMNLIEVLRLARQALDTAHTYTVAVPPESVTVEEMMTWLQRRVLLGPQPLDADALFAALGSADRKAALFLAMLEMTKAGRIRLEQHSAFAPISITKSADTAHPCRYI